MIYLDCFSCLVPSFASAPSSSPVCCLSHPQRHDESLELFCTYLWSLSFLFPSPESPSPNSPALATHCGKILRPIWVVLPPSTQLSWCYQPDKLVQSRNFAPAYLDGGLPARSTGIYVPAYSDGGLPARSTGTYVPAYLNGGLPARSTRSYVLAYLDGGLPAKSTGLVYQHTWVGVTICFRWRSSLN